MKKIKTIVFPVGGFGTRFLPATKATPKEMLPVAEKPLVQYAFEEAMDAGIEKFIFVTGRNKNSIEDHFDNAFELQKTLDEKKKTEMLEKTIGWLPPAGQIVFLRQQKPLGLGHAVLCAEKFVGDEPFAVSLADDMIYGENENFLKKMIDLAENKDASVIGIAEVEMKDIRDQEVISDLANLVFWTLIIKRELISKLNHLKQKKPKTQKMKKIMKTLITKKKKNQKLKEKYKNKKPKKTNQT